MHLEIMYLWACLHLVPAVQSVCQLFLTTIVDVPFTSEFVSHFVNFFKPFLKSIFDLLFNLFFHHFPLIYQVTIISSLCIGSCVLQSEFNQLAHHRHGCHQRVGQRQIHLRTQ